MTSKMKIESENNRVTAELKDIETGSVFWFRGYDTYFILTDRNTSKEGEITCECVRLDNGVVYMFNVIEVVELVDCKLIVK